jgi:hypothetical protein
MSKAPKIQVTIFNNKADADAYIEKQKIKIEEYKSKLGTGRNIDRIKEELAALEGKTETTPQVRTIEEIKNDIAEFRAQEQAEYAAMSDPNDTVEKNRIYTVYDKIITPLINEAEADIEARKKEELSVEEYKPKNTIGYLPIPNNDGSFSTKSFSKTPNESSSMFEVEDLGNDRISVSFWNNNRAVQDATSAPELILNPIVRLKDALNQNTNKITTTKPAIFKKQGDKYVLEQMAEMYYSTPTKSNKEISEINAKYKAELDAVKEVKPAVSTTKEVPTIESKETPVVEITPTEPTIIESSNGVSFTIILDEDDDYSITTTEEIEKSVSLQDKVNTLIEKGKATKFCK